MASAPETSPADAAERSADRAADAAVRGELPAQARGAGTAPNVGTPPWGAGRRLSVPERAWHEPRLGASLGDVRVHEGAAPARWAAVLGARAFAFGRDVVFGAGQHAPGTDAGRRLMAHELSHVVAGRGRPLMLARVALTSDDFDALAQSIHDVVGSLAADEELIYVALQKLERDQAAIASLTSAYKKLFNADLATDLGTRLTGHGLGLAKTLLGQAKGLAVATAQPSTSAQFESIARAIHAALVGSPTDPESVYAGLIPLGRSASLVATLKTAYTKLFKADLEADLAANLAHGDLSYALYLIQAPGPASTHAPSIAYVAQPGFGTSPKTDKVAGGTVTAGTAVPYSYQPKDPSQPPVTAQYSFGFGYSGALSSDTRWLQFIEREIDSTDSKGVTTAYAKDVTIGSRTYPFTTSAASPAWAVDSDDASDPFFDETHNTASFRDATSVSAYDSPSPLDSIVAGLFTAGATSVTSRAHFDVYLIRDFAPIFHVEIEIVWTYKSSKNRTTSRTVKSTGAVQSLPSAQKAALVARYPAFAYIE